MFIILFPLTVGLFWKQCLFAIGKEMETCVLVWWLLVLWSEIEMKKS